MLLRVKELVQGCTIQFIQEVSTAPRSIWHRYIGGWDLPEGQIFLPPHGQYTHTSFDFQSMRDNAKKSENRSFYGTYQGFRKKKTHSWRDYRSKVTIRANFYGKVAKIGLFWSKVEIFLKIDFFEKSSNFDISELPKLYSKPLHR